MPPKPPQPLDPEPLEIHSDAGALVSQGATLMRIQNDAMLAVSMQRPRDEQKVIRGALAELDLAPEEAKHAFYAIPYQDRSGERTKVTLITGPSIHSAMALLRRWGNAAAGAIPLKEDATGWDVEGYFIDLESNIRIARPFRASKLYKPRGGKLAAVLPPDRQLQAFQSGVSKAIRNATLAGLPTYLVSAYVGKARQLVGGKPEVVASPQTCQAILQAFARWQISQAQLEGWAEKPLAQWTGSDVADLRGLWNAIHDEQISPEEAFALDGQPAGQGTATSTLDALAAKIVEEAATTDSAPDSLVPIPSGAPASPPPGELLLESPPPPEKIDPARTNTINEINEHLGILAEFKLRPKLLQALQDKHLGKNMALHQAAQNQLEAFQAELTKLVALIRPPEKK